MMDPLQGLKEWHVWLTLLLACAGIIGILYEGIRLIIWLFNHIHIS